MISINNTFYKSYLHHTCQRLSIQNKKINNSSLSNWPKVKRGIPQGCILGPLLFLIYMSDLPKVITDPYLYYLLMTLVFYSATPILKVLGKMLIHCLILLTIVLKEIYFLYTLKKHTIPIWLQRIIPLSICRLVMITKQSPSSPM